MATYARRHGGDGGDRPPHGHSSRIPGDCESSQPRKVRGRAKNKNLLEKFAKNNNKPLSLSIDPNPGHKFVGEHGSMFIRLVSSEVARVPCHYESWDKVPENYKLGIFRTLNHYFDLRSWNDTPQWNGIRMGINEDCATKFRNHKFVLKKHFDIFGGYDDLVNARRNPHDTQTQESWNKLIDDLFLDQSYRDRSAQNSKNRSKQRYSSTGGSRSYAQMRYDNIHESGSTSLIEDWGAMHCKKGGSWVNDEAADDWERIKEERQRMQLEAGDGPIDEELCLRRVLGDRRGWVRGVGRKLRNLPPDVSCVSNPTQSQFEEMQESMRQMNENMKRLHDELNELKSKKGRQSSSEEDDEV